MSGKQRPKQRASAKVAKFAGSGDVDKRTNTVPWARLQARKADRKRVQALQREMEQSSADRKRQKREEQEERKKRRMQNEFNAATTQTLLLRLLSCELPQGGGWRGSAARRAPRLCPPRDSTTGGPGRRRPVRGSPSGHSRHHC